MVFFIVAFCEVLLKKSFRQKNPEVLAFLIFFCYHYFTNNYLNRKKRLSVRLQGSRSSRGEKNIFGVLLILKRTSSSECVFLLVFLKKLRKNRSIAEA
ncbi:hypothetical protein BAU14_07035 [Enterococcus sp. CU9D]|nr:hypothetical protein BAU14_07035 [Enterococcus sp. CU9D]